MYKLETIQFIPISLSTAWDFFSSPKNLSRITPPEMGFQILSELPEGPIYKGLQIDYRVKPLLGIPMHWKTEIGETDSVSFFTDTQLKGPYKKWEHTHTFVATDKGVWMTDVVVYELPFGFIGKWAHSLFIRKKIEQIFQYRKQILNVLFPENE